MYLHHVNPHRLGFEPMTILSALSAAKGFMGGGRGAAPKTRTVIRYVPAPRPQAPPPVQEEGVSPWLIVGGLGALGVIVYLLTD